MALQILETMYIYMCVCVFERSVGKCSVALDCVCKCVLCVIIMTVSCSSVSVCAAGVEVWLVKCG